MQTLVWAAVAVSALGAGAAAPETVHWPVLGVSGGSFTLDGQAKFLLGASYYAALGVEDEQAIRQDLDELRACGVNWIRVWATWAAYDNDVSAITPEGAVRAPYMERLERICAMAGTRGMVVDVTLSRGAERGFPATFEQHRAMLDRIAVRLKAYRNVYFDVANERNIGDARHVSMAEVGDLVRLVKSVDAARLCTASHGGDISAEEVAAYTAVGGVDFLAPHRPRDDEASGQVEERTREYVAAVKATGRIVPVLYQEPFRRDYGAWQPTAKDFVANLEGARAAGAAGWCFHNGGARENSGAEAEDGRPRRSFDMRSDEGRLFEQLDNEERAFLGVLKQRAGR